jgi:hypothetical protein
MVGTVVRQFSAAISARTFQRMEISARGHFSARKFQRGSPSLTFTEILRKLYFWVI